MLWILFASTLMFVGSIFLAGTLIVRMPADYLTRDGQKERRCLDQHPLVRGLIRLAKNGAGLAIMASGLVMLFTPGQGILFIVLGLTLLDFPGKRKLLRRLLGRQNVLKMINQIRLRAKQPPLESPHAST